MAIVGCLADVPAPMGGDAAAEAEAILDWLSTLAGPNGFDIQMAPYVVEAAWASGRNPTTWPASSPVLGDVAVPASGSLLQALRPLHALAVAHAPGAQARQERILAAFDGEQFGERALLNDDAFALLALRHDGLAAGHPAIVNASRFLLAQQDGGWSHAVGGQASVDVTGFVVAALHAAGRLAEADLSAVRGFLEAARDGSGFAERPGGQANCNSSAWAVRSLALLGEPAAAEAGWTFLASLRQDDGSVAYAPGQAGNALCSAEAATAWGLRATQRLTVFV